MKMRIKKFSIVLSVIVVMLAVVSCVTIPLDESSAEIPSKPVNSTATSSVSEPEESEPASASEEPASKVEASEPSSEVSEEGSSEPDVSEESSAPVLDLPYKDFDGLTLNNIGVTDYDAYFRDSMFIGNSIMVHFYNYYSNAKSYFPGFMGNCAFFASSNFSCRENAKTVSDETWHPKYQGTKMNCADAVVASGVKTVYLSVMALNEMSLNGTATTCVDGTYKTTTALVESIRAAAPDVTIVMLSNTYMCYNYNSYGKLNNANISALNNLMLNYCNEKGIDFIDVSTFLMEGNVLANKYCRDYEISDANNGCHLTNDAYCMWVATLRNYVYLKQNNAWQNPVTMPVYEKNPS